MAADIPVPRKARVVQRARRELTANPPTPQGKDRSEVISSLGNKISQSALHLLTQETSAETVCQVLCQGLEA